MRDPYYGNQPTAYGPIDTPRFAVPLVEGSRKTTYRIRVVGPALLGGVEASLTGAQASKLFQVSVRIHGE